MESAARVTLPPFVGEAYEVYVNGLFTSVTICVPGTSSCQTLDGVLVDSGSSGLRLLASQVRRERAKRLLLCTGPPTSLAPSAG